MVAGAGSNDTRHAIHLTEPVIEAGAHAVLSVTPYYNKPNRRGIIRHFEEVARAAAGTPVILYNIPGRTAVNMPPDLLAELGQIDGIEAVKQANSDELQPIDGLAVLAGNDDILAANLDHGGAGGICVATHVVGNEMKRLFDEPENRAEIDASLRDVYSTIFLTASPTCTKAALNLLGLDAGGCACRWSTPTSTSSQRSARCSSATGCSSGPPRVSGTLRVLPLGGLGEIGKNMTRRRVRRPDRRRRLRAALPDRRDDGHRPRPARLHLPARARRRHRGDRHHARPRGPPRRAAVGAARAGGDHGPGHLRRAADGRHGALQARRAPAARGQARGAPDRADGAGGPVRDRARAPHALDPRHVSA